MGIFQLAMLVYWVKIHHSKTWPEQFGLLSHWYGLPRFMTYLISIIYFLWFEVTIRCRYNILNSSMEYPKPSPLVPMASFPMGLFLMWLKALLQANKPSILVCFNRNSMVHKVNRSHVDQIGAACWGRRWFNPWVHWLCEYVGCWTTSNIVRYHQGLVLHAKLCLHWMQLGNHHLSCGLALKTGDSRKGHC